MDQVQLKGSMRDYWAVKEWFEREWAFVPHYDRYLLLNRTQLHGEIVVLTVPQFKIQNRILRYTHVNGTKKVFINRWLDDENKKTYTELNLGPFIRNAQHIYNVWGGFAAEKLPPIDDDALIAELIQPIWNHLSDVVTRANEIHTGYIMDFLANIIQNPGQRATEAIQLCGENAYCKQIIFDFFREKVLGKTCSLVRGIAHFKNMQFDMHPKVFMQVKTNTMNPLLLFG